MINDRALGCKQMQMKREMQNGCPNANNGYKRANKPKKKKHGGREEEKQQQQTLSENKEEARTVCVKWDKGWTHVVHVHNTTHLAVPITVQGN